MKLDKQTVSAPRGYPVADAIELAEIERRGREGAKRHAERMALIERCGPLVNITEADLAKYLRWAERDRKRAEAEAAEIDASEWGESA